MTGVRTFADLEEIERLYAERGGLTYGEGVSLTEHSVQCAALAQAQGARPSLVAAALLHDVGHLFEDEAVAVEGRFDARHEISGAQALRRLFDEAVRGPIALHVAAKRYLCLKEPGYFEALSDASKLSLGLQGGPFDAAEADAFERLPHWRDAVVLRRLDETGKDDALSSAAFASFMPLLRTVVLA